MPDGTNRHTNEGKACDAVIRLLERLTRRKRRDVRIHADAGNGKKVEVRLRLGAQEYAIEHTVVETLEGQIYAEKRFVEFGHEIQADLRGKLPLPGWYYLILPHDAWTRTKGAPGWPFKQEIIEWVREQADQLYRRNSGRPKRSENEKGYSDTVTGTLTGVPFELTLERKSNWAQPPKHDGLLIVRPCGPSDLEPKRRSRLDRALRDKCSKLQSCKDGGALSVLVLETRDAASNHMNLAEDLVRSLSARPDAPDHIYLVDTLITDWFISRLKVGTRLIPDNAGVEFAPDELTDLTLGSPTH